MPGRKPPKAKPPKSNLHLRRIRLAQGVRLDATAAGSSDTERKWVQVALENTYLGYARGEKPFMFTRAVFEQMVANIHEHPSYKPDGSADIIHWDFEHSSEPPFYDEMALRTAGIPAQGWTSDLEVRDGTDADGKPRAELWALTRFLEPARSYIADDKYKGASIAVDFNHIDPVTAERTGARITSIALTNVPFIQGMVPIPDSVAASMNYYYEQAASPADAFRCLKQLFGLGATAEVPELMVELGKLEQWAATGAFPLGVEGDEIIGAMRKILGLPALSTAQEALDNARQIVNRLLEESGVMDGATPPMPGAPAATTTANRRTEMELIKFLASLLGVRESEDAVKDTVKELVALRDGLVTNLKLSSHSAPSVLLKAAGETADARSKLGALLKALGVEDADGAVDRVAQLMESADELKKVMPELEGLRTEVKKTEEKAQEADVEQAMASYNLPEATKAALLLLRRTDAKKFAEDYPKKAPPKQPKGVTLAHAQLLREPATRSQAGVAGGEVINLSMFEGRNTTERAMTYLSGKMSGWDKMTREARFKAAVEFKKQENVVDEPAESTTAA